MITWVSESFSQKSNLITAEILNESSSYSNFSNCLISTLWAASLYIVNEEIKNLWVMEDFSAFPHNTSEHYVSLLVFEWVMKSTLGSILNAIDKWLYLICLGVGDWNHILACHWIKKSHVLCRTSPFSTNNVLSFIFNTEAQWVKCSKFAQMLGSQSCLKINKIRLASCNFRQHSLFKY